jgi:hypothetical protein
MSWPSLQEPATGPCPEPDASSLHLPTQQQQQKNAIV